MTEVGSAIGDLRTIRRRLRSLGPIDVPPPAGWSPGAAQDIDGAVEALRRSGRLRLPPGVDPIYAGRLAVDRAQAAGDAWGAADDVVAAMRSKENKRRLQQIEDRADKARNALLDLLEATQENREALSILAAVQPGTVAGSVLRAEEWMLRGDGAGTVDFLHPLADAFNSLATLWKTIEDARRSIDHKITARTYAFTVSMADSFQTMTGSPPVTLSEGPFADFLRAGWSDAFGCDPPDFVNIIRKIKVLFPVP